MEEIRKLVNFKDNNIVLRERSKILIYHTIGLYNLDKINLSEMIKALTEINKIVGDEQCTVKSILVL